MARIDWIEQRLQNWARWCLMGGSGVLGYAAVDLQGAGTVREPWAAAAIPTSDVEASETDEAVRRLSPAGLALTVTEHYVGRGGIKDKLARLGCIAEQTYHKRIDQAHRQLADHFLAKQDQQRAERARVEQLQTSIRPGGGFYGGE